MESGGARLSRCFTGHAKTEVVLKIQNDTTMGVIMYFEVIVNIWWILLTIRRMCCCIPGAYSFLRDACTRQPTVFCHRAKNPLHGHRTGSNNSRVEEHLRKQKTHTQENCNTPEYQFRNTAVAVVSLSDLLCSSFYVTSMILRRPPPDHIMYRHNPHSFEHQPPITTPVTIYRIFYRAEKYGISRRSAPRRRRTSFHVPPQQL